MHIRSFSVGGCMQEKINVLVATPSEFVTAETNETFLHFLFGGLNSQNVCTSCCFNTEFKWLKVMKHGRGSIIVIIHNRGDTSSSLSNMAVWSMALRFR